MNKELLARQLVFCIFLSITTQSISATTTVYETLSPDGVTEFSDQSTDGAIELHIDKVEQLKPDSSSTAKTPPPTSATPHQGVSVNIIFPSSQQNLWSGNGEIAIRFTANKREQVLRFKVFLDNRLQGETESNQFILHNVYRGQHNVVIKASTLEGQPVAESPARIFYVHRPSIIHPSSTD